MSGPQCTARQRSHWVGIDVSKQTFDAALLAADHGLPTSRLAELPAKVFARSRAGVRQWLAWLDGLLCDGDADVALCCVMEATGRYSTELAAWIVEQRGTVVCAIAPPRETAAFLKSLGLRNSTDRLAAQGLAFYGREREPRAYEPPSPEEQQLRDVCRYREDLVRQQTALLNQTGEQTHSPFVHKNRAKRLCLLTADVKRAEDEMRRVVYASANLSADIELLQTIYGVGFLTATVVRAELGDLRRFERARQLSAYAGLNPSIRQSGTSVRRWTHMGKAGNVRVRHALYMSSIVAIQGHNDFQRTYCRLLENGKCPMAALGAVMRKILVVMRAVLITGKPYRPDWKLCGKTLLTCP